MFALKPRKELALRGLLVTAVLLQAFIPHAAAMPLSVAKQTDDNQPAPESAALHVSRRGFEYKPSRAVYQETETPTPEPEFTPTPHVTSTPATEQTPIPTQISNNQTDRAELSAEFWAEPTTVKTGETVKFTLKIANVDNSKITSLYFSNFLPEGFQYAAGKDKTFVYDEQTRELTWNADADTTLSAGGSLLIEYTVVVETQDSNIQIIDTASLNARELDAPVLVEAGLVVAGAAESLTARTTA